MTILIAVVSDLHINSTVGLSLPRLELDDGGEYRASKTQRWLYECWSDFWREVEKRSSKDIKVMTLWNGDITDIDQKGRTHQVISRNKASALRHTAELLDRPLQLSEWAVFVRGTHSHTGRGSWTEEEIARDTDISVRASDDVYSWGTFYGNIGGLVVDAMHFVALGSQTRTIINPLGNIAEELELMHYRQRTPRPHLAIRSHRHTWADTGDNYPVRVVASGCFCGTPEYIIQHGRRQPPGIGGVIVTIEDDATWRLEKIKYAPAPQKVYNLAKLTG